MLNVMMMSRIGGSPLSGIISLQLCQGSYLFLEAATLSRHCPGDRGIRPGIHNLLLYERSLLDPDIIFDEIFVYTYFYPHKEFCKKFCNNNNPPQIFLMGASPRWSSQHNTMSISISNSIISVQRFRKQQSSFLSDPTTTCHMLCAAKVEQHEQRTGRSSLSLPSTCLHLPTYPPSSRISDLVHKN